MRRAPVTVLCAVQFVDVLGVTSATTAIPAVLAGLGLDAHAAGPLATAYAMFFGGLLVVGARLGDRYGHRRVLSAGLVGFAAVSLVGGLAGSLEQVLAARALQGAAAALSVPSALRLLLHATDEDDARRTALAAWSAAGAAAGAAGFVVGGALVELLDWRAVFWVNAPVGALLLVGVLLVVPAPAPDDPTTRLDLPGGALLVASVMCVVAAAAAVEQRAAAGRAGLLLLAGVAAAAGFVRRMRRAAAPLVPPQAWRSVRLRDGTVLSFVNTATTSASAVLATLHLQDELGLSALRAGLTLLGLSALVVVGSAASAPLLARWGPRSVAAAGLAVVAGGNVVLVLAGAAWAGIALGTAVVGLGLGLTSVAATSLGTDVQDELAGSASGILNTGAQLGTAVGTAVLVMLAGLASVTWAWAVAALLAAATAVWSWHGRRKGEELAGSATAAAG
ncbi:MAG: MFS transporter [Cellulomonas sp.]|uniref:MFS transporter n=1 Tax=Cellulomonas sp. TaxID=40001 RepID=UPI0019EBC66B|nr:MFS transporter [Cellulomonas sp.]MBF0686147.1 MFS transporter [Cellulomonas sp.]